MNYLFDTNQFIADDRHATTPNLKNENMKIHPRRSYLEMLENRNLLALVPFTYMWSESPSNTLPIESYVQAESEPDSTITSRKVETGVYEVRIHRFMDFERDPTSMHVTAYGESNGYCKVADFGRAEPGSHDFAGRVHCYNALGSPADSRFTATVFSPLDIGESVFANDRVAANYEVESNRGTRVEVSRTSTGFYQLTLHDTHIGDQATNVQVTAVGDDPNRCSVAGWVAGEDSNVWVACTNPAGERRNSMFTASLIQPSAYVEDYGFAWTETPDGHEFTPARFSVNPADRLIYKTRLAPGRYQVDFIAMNRFYDGGGHIMLNAYGNDGSYCNVVHWDSSSPNLTTIVNCFDSDGTAQDTRFSILAVPSYGRKPDKYEPNDSATDATLLFDDVHESNLNITAGDEDYFRWMNVSGSGTVTFNLHDFAFRGQGDLAYEVTSPDGTTHRSDPGYFENVPLSFESEPGDIFSIRVFSKEGFVNREYAFDIESPASDSIRALDSEVSYAVVSAGAIDATPFYAHNQADDGVTAQRLGTGRYELTFDRLAPLLGNGGNVQVMGEHGDQYCKTSGWQANGEGDVTIDVGCYDFGGNPTDSSFRAMVIPAAGELNFVYAWSHNLTVATNTAPEYTYNPAGDVHVRRTDTGRYRVQFEGLGDPLGGGNVQVTAYGDDSRRCNPLSWESVGGDFVAHILCMDSTGTQADSRFSIAALPPQVETEVIYAASDRPSQTEWPLSNTLTHVPDGTTLSKTHQSTGRYRVRLAGSSDQIFRGFTMVAALGTTADCTANTVDFDEQGVTCFDRSDRRQDSGFSMIVLPQATAKTTFDPTNDGVIDETDIGSLCAAIHSFPSTIFDFNEDGAVDRVDLVALIRDGLGTHFGDANLDGDFNSTDLIRVFAAGEYEDEIAGNSTWAEGDWNCDGEFDTSDLILAFADGGYESAAVGFVPTLASSVDLVDLAISLLTDETNDRPTRMPFIAMKGHSSLRVCWLELPAGERQQCINTEHGSHNDDS